MAIKKNSPNRRRSITGINQNSPSLVPKGRRRAHSIVPGATLSPLAKVRRSLAPRKSILKASVNTLNVDPSSQQSTVSSQASANDDTNATRSMEFTQDFAAPVHDNAGRKSFGKRRVSFARHSHVRMFDPKRKSDETDSSPAASPVAPPPQSNENDYPGQSSRPRRSSVRYSMAGSEDMDVTTIMQPSTFQARGSAILDEEFEFDDEDEDFGDGDMDMTEAVQGGFARKRSVSIGGRQSIAQGGSSPINQSFEGDGPSSDIGNESMQSDGTSEHSHAMEFTIPLGQSLRPAEKDDVWLALKQMTHSGDEPSEEQEPSSEEEDSHNNVDDGMPLDDAVQRLLRARASLPLSGAPDSQQTETHDNTFTDTEDSFNDDDMNMNDMDDNNKTLNLSRVIGRASIGLNSRMSMGYGSNMDESEVYGNIVAQTQSTPRHSLAPPSQPSQTEEFSNTDNAPPQPRKSLVFQPPPTTFVPPTAAVGQPRKSTGAFTPRAPSPSKTSTETPSKAKHKPTFSAAFAPPTVRPSPKKLASTTTTSTVITPSKRPHTSTQDDVTDMEIDQPSPAKRQALATKWLDGAEEPKQKSPSVSPVAERTAPAPLSPEKIAPFEPTAPTADSEPSTSQPQSALRRPSGYFARRKSMSVSFNIPANDKPQPAVAGSSTAKKTAAIGKGRASMGAVPANTFTRPVKKVTIPDPSSPLKSKGKEVEAKACIREAARQSSVSPSPTRGSPAPSRRMSSEPPLQPLPQPALPERRHLGRLDEEEEEEEEPEAEHESPAMEMETDATQQWREGVEQTDYDEEEDIPSISVAQFFSITGIKFMDELTAPRRSIHPSQQPLRQARNPSEIPLAEYVSAMAIDIPQLELYSRVSQDLEAWMAKSKIAFAQAEEEAAKVTPELFIEYARADEEGQAELLHQLNLIRTHTRYLARSDWYDWKLQWVEGLRVTADEAFVSLENDARMLEEPKKSAAEIIPALEEEYENLMLELEREQAEVAEIESGDQDYLNELKATIAEQNIEIEALKAELAEGTDQVRWLQERGDEIETQTREAKNTIATCERVLRMKQSSTRSEVFRLKDELEALEDLHMCRITRVNADLFEYIYSSIFQVSIPCKNFVPIVTKVNISRYGNPNTRYKDDFPRLSAFLLTTAKQLINQGDYSTVREVVQRLSDYWSSCAQLRSQLTLLSIKYPIEIDVPPPSKETGLPSFKAKAMVMFPSVMGKAYISFVFSFDTFARWPLSIDSLDCEVDIAYGSLDRSTVMQATVTRLSQATPSESYACLLDACIEAQDVYH